MAARRSLLLLLAVVGSLGANYQSRNFSVEAPTPEIAQQVAQYAEYYRREKALQWVGQEMPSWPQPCPIRVTVTGGGAGGATSFIYEQGQVLGQQMHIEGSLDRLLASVLPHEVTHTVFAHYYRRAVPRWADEGGAVLSEDEIERSKHDMFAWQIVNTPGRAIPLRRLFAMREYPHDVLCLYAEGYSVTSFLVSQSGRPTFLAFVGAGMREGWDNAVRSYYHYNSVEELEQAWVNNLRTVHRAPAPMQTASSGGRAAAFDPANRITVRQTAPPVEPLPETPPLLVRAQAPDRDPDYGGWAQPPRSVAAGNPSYASASPYPTAVSSLPSRATPSDSWQPPLPPPPPPSVRLGTPEPLR